MGDVDLGDVRTCVGLGLRLDTPVGPLRVDVGYNLNRRPDEPSSVLHVALGHAF
jgi:outer membrane protein insertion porin family